MYDSYDTTITFGTVLPSRGEDLARRLLEAQAYALNERQLRLVQHTAYLMYHLSPTKGRKQPAIEVLEEARQLANELQRATAEEAGFPRIPSMNKALEALGQESRVSSIRAYVLVVATQRALAMGVATVPIKAPRAVPKWGEPPFVRDRPLAQNCHQYARKLLELLPPHILRKRRQTVRPNADTKTACC